MDEITRLQSNDDSLAKRLDALSERVSAMESQFLGIPALIRNEIRNHNNFMRALLIGQFLLCAANFAGMFFGR